MVLVLRLRLAVLLLAHLLAVLLIDGFLLYHSVIYGAHKQAHNKEKEIKAFLLSSNEEMKVGRLFLGDFLMARLKLYWKRRGRILEQSEDVWRMK